MANRWWIYQRERFPVGAHALLAAVASLCALAYSALLRGQPGLPAATALGAATLSALAFFIQMRVADEFKDREDDARCRPYRPVPRGLVNLRELACIGCAAALLQLAVALAAGPQLLLPLALAWAFFALMCAEFFAGSWLKKRPLAYMLSHLPIVSLIVLHLSAFDWLRSGSPPPAGLGWLLATAFLVGTVLELGRKIRGPGDEEPGVVTYSAAWGCRTATLAWLLTLLLLGGVGWAAARRVGFAAPFAAITAALGLWAGCTAWHFVRAPDRRGAEHLQALSKAAALLVYLGLGPAPLLLR